MITTTVVQDRLAGLGFHPGPLDGVRGRRTIAAVKTFQRRHGLPPDGLVGATTAAILFGDADLSDALPDRTPWMDVAERMMGLHEALDRETVARFLASDGGTSGDPATVPWCADFVQTCIALSMPDEPLPVDPYASVAWRGFGRPVEPCFGAILCFWPEQPESWKGQVGFCVDATERDFLLRGGNQSDSISERRISREFLRPDGSRWPLTALAPAGPARVTTG